MHRIKNGEFILTEGCPQCEVDMKQTGIIMSDSHPVDILEGRKTMTRRTYGLEFINKEPDVVELVRIEDDLAVFHKISNAQLTDYFPPLRSFPVKSEGVDPNVLFYIKCPYGQVGDRLFTTQGSSATKSIPLEERFWSRIIKFDNHWEWMGHTNRKKYGMIKWDNRDWSVHRLMWKLQVGEIPAGTHVLHKCDMPWCVNPDHLYLGTNDDNIADKVARNRVPKPRGMDNGQSSLTSMQVEEIRSLYWEQWLYQHEIASQFSISQSEVSRIVNSKRWLAETEYPEKETGHRTLEITDIRVERLNQITEEDVIAEGIPRYTFARGCASTNPPDPRWKFIELWDSLNAKRGYSFESNPWVFVISFRKVEK